MIRRKLAEVPVEKGTQVSFAILWCWLGFAVGWAAHEWSMPVFCWYAA